MIRDFATQHARRLCRHAAFAAADERDVSQEMLLALLPKLSAYDSTRGCFSTFLKCVLERIASSMIRRATAKCRKPAVPHEAIGWLEPPADRRGSYRGIHHVDAQTRMELAHDVESRLAALPPDLQRLAQLLCKHSPRSAAQQMAWTPLRVRRGIQAIRRQFEDGNLAEYL